MGLARRIDEWVGWTLFIPPIIRLCQKLEWSQHRMANVMSFIGALCMIPMAVEWNNWFFYFCMGVVIICEGLIVAMKPEYEGDIMGRFWRLFDMVLLQFAMLIAVSSIMTGKDFAVPLGLTLWLFLRVGEDYARTIYKIPPLEDEQRFTQVAYQER